jgi:hypothetical protein
MCRNHFITGFPSIRVFRRGHDDIYIQVGGPGVGGVGCGRGGATTTSTSRWCGVGGGGVSGPVQVAPRALVEPSPTRAAAWARPSTSAARRLPHPTPAPPPGLPPARGVHRGPHEGRPRAVRRQPRALGGHAPRAPRPAGGASPCLGRARWRPPQQGLLSRGPPPACRPPHTARPPARARLLRIDPSRHPTAPHPTLEQAAPTVHGCNMAGFVLVKKVPGTLHFTARGEGHSFDHAWMNMTHAVHQFYFGSRPSSRKL